MKWNEFNINLMWSVVLSLVQNNKTINSLWRHDNEIMWVWCALCLLLLWLYMIMYDMKKSHSIFSCWSAAAKVISIYRSSWSTQPYLSYWQWNISTLFLERAANTCRLRLTSMNQFCLSHQVSQQSRNTGFWCITDGCEVMAALQCHNNAPTCQPRKQLRKLPETCQHIAVLVKKHYFKVLSNHVMDMLMRNTYILRRRCILPEETHDPPLHRSLQTPEPHPDKTAGQWASPHTYTHIEQTVDLCSLLKAQSHITAKHFSPNITCVHEFICRENFAECIYYHY